ncbi:hypothetical protein GALL_339390 [mine drainage metagenome]|uniref:Uncharacterized protein n=1 Tax=mine drainage metagenome TaxID=410659 RepID=A0A1J5QLD0_9ZZZZ
MHKILLENLPAHFVDGDYVLMVGLSFDSRCLTALSYFPRKRAIQIVGISNAGWGSYNKNSITEFVGLVGAAGIIIGNNAASVMDVADELVEFINSVLDCPEKTLVIDITSLSHELLVMLLGMLNSLQVMNRATLLYVGAAEYSFNAPGDAVWLSRGVRSIRSVLGFPGTMLPSKKLHLVVLAGFEVERAAEVIVRYEPASMSIGLGKRDQSVSEAHHDKNKLFFDRLNKFVKEQDADNQEIHHFEFSCVDPLQTKSQLLSHIDSLKALGDKNIVICPLNTKLSTVGVVLATIEHPEIQICYAEPDEYNAEGYSKPGTEVTIFSLKDN